MKRLSIGLGLALALCLPATAQTTNDNMRVTQDGVWYTVSRGETLSSISLKFTGEIRYWRTIGHSNKIENDRTIPIGRVILVPAVLLTPVSAFARITSFFGEVAIKDSHGSSIEAKVDTLLKEGDTLTTMAKSFISLALEDGSRITLSPDSELNLRTLRMTQYVKSPRTSLFLEKGRVESNVTPFSKPGSRYEVLSPLAVSGVRGTNFRVEYTGKATLNEVIQGKVGVQAITTARVGKTERVLSNGLGSIVRDGKVGQPEALPGAPKTEDGYQLQQKLPIEFHVTQTNAAAFRVRISRDQEASDNIAETDTTASDGRGTLRIADLPDGDYFAHISTIDTHGMNGIRQTLPFRVDARPFPPFLIAPDRKFQGTSSSDLISVPLQWTLSDNMTAYRIQVASDTRFTDIKIDHTTSGDSNGNHVVMLPVGNYYWRIASLISHQGMQKQGPFGDPRPLEIISAQQAPLIAISEHDIRFSWSEGKQNEQFVFQLASDEQFSHVIHEAKTTTAETSIPRPQPGTYHARVRSVHADGFEGAYSPAQKLVIPLVWQTEYGGPLRAQEQAIGSSF